MKTFTVAGGESWKMDTAGILALTITLHNQSPSDIARYSATLGPLSTQGSLGGGEDVSIGRWLAGGAELTVKNDGAPGGPTISGAVIGGTRLPGGESMQIPTIAGSSVQLSLVNESTLCVAYARTWCGGKDSPVETHKIPAGTTFATTMACGGNPVNVTNIKVDGGDAALIAAWSPAG
jgi:hypothetical protein